YDLARYRLLVALGLPPSALVDPKLMPLPASCKQPAPYKDADAARSASEGKVADAARSASEGKGSSAPTVEKVTPAVPTMNAEPPREHVPTGSVTDPSEPFLPVSSPAKGAPAPAVPGATAVPAVPRSRLPDDGLHALPPGRPGG